MRARRACKRCDIAPPLLWPASVPLRSIARGTRGGGDMALQAQSLIGLAVIPLLAWALSENRRRASCRPGWLRIVLAGLGLQLVIAAVMLNVACRARRLRLGRGPGRLPAGRHQRRHAPRVRLSRRRPRAVRGGASRDQLHPGLPRAAAHPADQRAVAAALSLGRAAGGGARGGLGAAALARRIRPGRHVGGSQHLRRHGGGAAADPPLPRQHEPRRPVRDHDGRHGRRGRHRAGALRDRDRLGGAGRGRTPDRRLGDQRAGGAACCPS